MSNRTHNKRRHDKGGRQESLPSKVQHMDIIVSCAQEGGPVVSETLDNPVGRKDSETTTERLGRTFYDIPGEDLAKALLGQKIVRMVDGVRLCAKIVETEAYLGAADKAAHSYKRQTDRNKAMFMQPGTAYVYNIYGMYCCLNISSQGKCSQCVCV